MNVKDQIASLNLNSGEFLVVGSGILAALGIRESDDIDMIVSQEIFKRLEALGWDHDTWADDQVVLKHGPFDVGTKWEGKTIDQLIDRAVLIDGIPYLSLEDLRAWKEAKGRDKDIRDIGLIDQYLSNHPS